MSQPFGNISSDQIRDSDIVTEAELGAVRLSNPITDKFPQTLDSTDNASSTLTDNSYDFEGFSIQPGNIVHITSGDAQGVYVVASVDSSNQLTLETAPPNATTGDYTIYHQAGAKIVGVDNSTWVDLSGSTLQQVLDEIDGKLQTNMSPTKHENLDQLVHHLAEPNYTEVIRDGEFVVRETVWQSASKNTKIREWTYTWNNRLLDQATVKQYNENGDLLKTITRDYTRGPNRRVTSHTDTVS